MSELKVIDLGNIRESIEKGESVYYEYYAKSEADKVIAELKDDVTYWKKVAKKNMDDNVAMARERAKAFESEHRRKHKQCVAMARWCASRSASWCLDPADEQLHKSDFYDKWHKRWLELAEKFKEAKEY